MRVRVGTSGWGYPAWRGRFYPAALEPAEFLAHYARRFAAVEVNRTFRALPAAATWRTWRDAVPAGFRFAVKAPARITHGRRLRGVADDCARLARAVAALGPRRGPVLWQLPPNLARDLPLLEDALAAWPRGERLAVEFRHASWFDDPVFAALAARRVALCIAETEAMTTPLVATAAWGYLRLRRLPYGDRALDAWARRILAQPWRDAVVFLRHEDTARGAADAARLADRCDAVTAGTAAAP